MMQAPPTRHGSFAQTLHWITAIVVLTAFVAGPEGSEQQVYQAANDFQRQLHETLGIGVLLLTVVRVLWKTVDARPAPVPVARWMSLASRAVQVAVYVLLGAVPLSAMFGAWLEAHPVTLLGGLQLAPALAPAPAWGARLATLHGWLGDALLWLAGAHAGAAIYHHAVLKDRVLIQMLPRWLRVRR